MQEPLRKESRRISTRARLCDTLQENAAGPGLENPAAQTLREPAQSKCTWTSHKSNYMRQLQEKCRAQDLEKVMPQTL